MMTQRNNNQDATAVIQWNCRGIRDKMGALQQYLETLNPQPEIIALQETNGPARLPGFITYADPSGKSTAILVKGSIAAVQHLTSQKGCEHTLVEIIPRTTKNAKNYLY